MTPRSARVVAARTGGVVLSACSGQEWSAAHEPSQHWLLNRC